MDKALLVDTRSLVGPNVSIFFPGPISSILGAKLGHLGKKLGKNRGQTTPTLEILKK